MAAAVLGALAWPSFVASARRRDVLAGATAIAELAVVGVFLGASAAALIPAATAFCYAVLRASGRFWPPARRLGWAGCLAAVTLIFIVGRPYMAKQIPGMAEPHDWTLLVVAGVVVALSAIAARSAATADERSPSIAGD
jgi:hypothetical protein